METKYTVEDLKEADDFLESRSKEADLFHLLDEYPVDEKELVDFALNKFGMNLAAVGTWCAGFVTALVMVYEKEKNAER